MTQRIKVIIRPKPLAKDQIKTFTNIDYINSTIAINKITEKNNYLPKDNSVRSFAFTKILMPDVSQEEIYEDCAFSLVENVLEGYNGTIFAYGQTGSGKTFTIMGGKEYLQRKVIKKEQKLQSNQNKMKEESKYVNELKGIIPRSFNQIITVTKSQKDKKHLIQCSFIQIYNQNVHDLLGEDTKSNLHLKENSNKGLVIQGLKTFLVKSVQELQRFFKMGYRNRSVRQTNMNKESSRSHCIFTIKVQEQTTDELGNVKFKVGKLNIVDLAGSERQNKTNIKDEGIKQASKINLSLSALGKVINCLSNMKQNQKSYIPYRESKLTRILQDSLGGNTKTVMIATISQNSTNYEETLSTLIYASRAKFIQNKPVLNEDPKDVLLREYVQQIHKLKSLLKEKETQNQDLKKTHVNFNPRQSTSKMPQIIYEQEEQIKLKIHNLQKLVQKDQSQNQQQKKQMQKIQQLKVKIKVQQQREQQLQRRNKKRQEELLMINKQYKTLNEQIDTVRYKFKQLKKQYLEKCSQLDDFQQEYNQEKLELNYVVREKDKQIRKLERLLQEVLDEKNYRQVIDQDQNRSSDFSSSNYSSNKLNFQVQKKAKINLADRNLFKAEEKIERHSSSQHSQPKKKKTSQYKILYNSVQKKKNYESDHGKASKNQKMMHPKGHSSYTSMKEIKQIKQIKMMKELSEAKQAQIKRQRSKKINSLMSLKNLKKENAVKLPFITQVKKLNSSRESRELDKEESIQYSKIGLDIAKIKNDIINELRYNKRSA